MMTKLRLPLRGLASLIYCLLLAGCSVERDLKLIFDTSNSISGATKFADEITHFAYDGSNTVFAGKLTDDRGVVVHVNSVSAASQLAVDDAIAPPTGEGIPFSDLYYSAPDIDNYSNDSVTFTSLNPSNVYTTVAGPLRRLVSVETSVPPIGLAYWQLFDSRISNAQTVFHCGFYKNLDDFIGSGRAIVLVSNAGVAKKVAADGDVIPGRGEKFGYFGRPQIDGTRILFWGTDQDETITGLYWSDFGNGTYRLVESIDRAPGGTGFNTFANGFFINHSIVGTKVYFGAFTSDGRVGIYRTDTVTAIEELIVDSTRRAPNGSPFISFEDMAPIEGTSEILFTGITQGPSNPLYGVYRTDGTTIQTVVAPGDTIKGKKAEQCVMSVDAVNGMKAAIKVSFSSDIPTIYTALYEVDLSKPTRTAGEMISQLIERSCNWSPSRSLKF